MDRLGMIGWNGRLAFERLGCKIAQRIGLDVELLKAANCDELSSEQTVSGPPCVVLPGQVERIRACAFGADVVQEIAKVQGAPRKLEPTLKYVLKDVLVDQGIIYRRGRQTRFNPELLAQRCNRREQYDLVVLRSSMVGCYFFGHWLRDDCATHLLAEEIGTPMSMPTPLWPDRSGYLALFGQRYDELGSAHVRRLVLFRDIAQNADKARRFHALRARVAKSLTSHTAGKIVYLMRGAGGQKRALINESEIIETLSRRGVVIVKSEEQIVPQLIRVLFGARIVISIEGSQLSHALYTMRHEGGLMVIQPPDRFFNSHRDWAHALNMKYAIVVGELREEGFHVPIDDLLRTLDLLDAAVA
jgi:hypothetical protein